MLKITPDAINLSGDVGETVEGSFDVELTAPFSGVPSPSVTRNRAGVPSGSTLRITIRGMKGAWKDTSYNNIIKMYFSLKSDRLQTCTETLNFTVQVL